MCTRNVVVLSSNSVVVARPANGSLHSGSLVDAPAVGHVDRNLDPVGLEGRLVAHLDVVPAVVQHDIARELRVDRWNWICAGICV